MGEKTKIPWCDSTCNIVMGCSQSCEVGSACFAERLCRRFAGKNPGFPKGFSKPELFLRRLADLRKWPDLTGQPRPAVKDFKGRVLIPAKPHLDGMPRLVFLADLGEMFDLKLPPEWLARRWREPTRQTVLEYLASLPHILIILTKRAERMHDCFEKFPCPPNVWLGVSVTDQKSADERLPWLQKIKCETKIISHEPATGGIDYSGRLRDVSGLISGGQSGPRAAPCELAWLRSDRDQAKCAGAAWFMKQLGAHVIDQPLGRAHPIDGLVVGGWRRILRHPSGADPAEWPEDLQGCREVPKP